MLLCCQLVAGVSANYNELWGIVTKESQNITSTQMNRALDLVKTMEVSELNEWDHSE